MNRIDGKPKTLQELLQGKKYTVHYYQREYRWGRKQIEQLIDDLTSTFNDNYVEEHETSEVENYSYYYMGSIIRTDGKEKAIIDGQQRLTTLTLLLIYLNNLQKVLQTQQVQVEQMIYSDSFGKMSFNLDVAERKKCFESLFKNTMFDVTGESESVQTMYARYQDIDELFPDDLKNGALPLFLYWIKDRIMFIEIVTPTEQDAHKIFVTMNDRGLNLNNAEMLKGYLLSEISNDDDREEANLAWKDTVLHLKTSFEFASEGIINTEDVEFISTWLRAKYAQTIREGKRGAKDKDYEIIGNEFHQWVRLNAKKMGLIKSQDYKSFVCNEFKKYAKIYTKIKNLSKKWHKDYEHVFYNGNRSLNYQNMLILSAIALDDNDGIVDRKIRLVSYFIDMYMSIRIFNYKKVSFNNVRYVIFRIMKEIRNQDIASIATILVHELNTLDISIDDIKYFKLNQFTVFYLLHTLARFTSFINQEMGNDSEFEIYIDRNQKNSFDVEHILSNDFEEYVDDFESEDEFQLYRSKLGNLIILPRDKNRSYQEMPYSQKVKKYMGDNILARSLNVLSYSNNPSFLKLPYAFKPYDDFGKTAIDERQALFASIAKDIWNVENLKRIADAWDFELEKKLIAVQQKQEEKKVKGIELSNTQELRTIFWKKLLTEINKHTDLTHGLALDTIRTENWINVGSGMSGVVFVMNASSRGASISLDINVGSKEENKEFYDKLIAYKDAIEQSFGKELEWHRLDSKKVCIVLIRDFNLNFYEESQWGDIIQFFVENFEKFVKTFKPYLK